MRAQTPTFRAGVNIVRVDASVADAKGAPVRGLTAADFTVLEDGQPRPIVAFEAIEMPPDVIPPGEAPWVRTAPRDVVTNRIEDRRLFMIVIDDATLPRDPVIIANAKRIAADIVSRLGDHDRSAVVFTRNSRKAQPLTSDRAQLVAAINATEGGTLESWTGNADVQIFIGATQTLRQSVESMMTASQVRKTLVFISTGLPMDPTTFTPTMSKFGTEGTDVSVPNVNAERDWLLEMNALFQQAERGHVRVYTFDPQVHDELAQYIAARRNKPGGGWQVAGLGRPDATLTALDAQSSLIDMAEQTGGRAAVGGADRAQGVTQMFADSSTFYVIGFQSASESPGRHRVEIRTTRPGAHVQTRKTFEVLPPAKPVAATASSPLAEMRRNTLPEDGLPLRVATTSTPSPDGKGAVVAIVLGINQPTDDAEASDLLTTQIFAYETNGKFAASTQLDANLSMRPGDDGRVQYELFAKLALKPGRYQLRIAAHGPRLNLRGSVFVDLEVPDFSKAAVTLAPLTLSSSPAPKSAPSDAFAGLLPVVPTSHRSFAAGDKVSVLARVVQGGRGALRPVTVDTRIVDTKNHEVYRGKDAMSASAASRLADYTFDVPLASLDPGSYLLTVTARTDAGTAERTLRFERR